MKAVAGSAIFDTRSGSCVYMRRLAAQPEPPTATGIQPSKARHIWGWHSRLRKLCLWMSALCVLCVRCPRSFKRRPHEGTRADGVALNSRVTSVPGALNAFLRYRWEASNAGHDTPILKDRLTPRLPPGGRPRSRAPCSSGNGCDTLILPYE